MTWLEFRKTRLLALEKGLGQNKVDEPVLLLLDSINKNKQLVTTSSCAGRIVLLEFDISKRKQTSKFYKKWHGKVDPEEVELALTEYIKDIPLWFRVEPFILHVAASNMKNAKEFLDKIRRAGVKRGGIQGIQNDRVTVEVQGTTVMCFPVDPIEGRWNKILEIANKMMDNNFSQIKKLEKIKF